MSAAGQLYDVTQAMRVLRQMRGMRAETLRQPGQSAAQHYAAQVSDHEWSALTTALDVLAREAGELQDMVDAETAMQRRAVGHFAQHIIDRVQP